MDSLRESMQHSLRIKDNTAWNSAPHPCAGPMDLFLVQRKDCFFLPHQNLFQQLNFPRKSPIEVLSKYLASS